jgi:ankyrin repeat protein
MEGLKAAGVRALEAVLSVLRTGDVRDRTLSLDVLGEIEHPDATRAIISSLADREKLVRKQAAEALGSIEDDESVAALVQAVGDEELDVSWAASVALGKLKAAGVKVPDDTAIISERELERGWDLCWAAEQGESDEVKALVEDGVGVNWRQFDETALHMAAEDRQGAAVQTLLELGADLSLTDDSGDSPLHIAARHGEVGLIESLIGAGADPNARNRDGETPLFDPARFGYLGAIEALVSLGADVNVQDHWGRTPLFVGLTRLEVAKLLVELGARPQGPGSHKSEIDEATRRVREVNSAECQQVLALLSGTPMPVISGWKVDETWVDWSIASPEVASHRRRIQEAKTRLRKELLGSGDFGWSAFLVYRNRECAEEIHQLLIQAGCPKTSVTKVQFNPDSSEWFASAE